MNIGCRQLCYQWQASLIDDDVVFASELSPVCGIAVGVIPSEGGERTLAESMLARSHAI